MFFRLISFADTIRQCFEWEGLIHAPNLEEKEPRTPLTCVIRDAFHN